jgi:hypothetical protein
MASFVTLRKGVPYLVSVAGLGAPYDQYVAYPTSQSAPFDITLPNSQSYNLGQNELLVFENGVALTLGEDYVEKSTTQITINRNLSANTQIRIRR